MIWQSKRNHFVSRYQLGSPVKYYIDKIAVLIRDHSFLMAFLAISISLIGGAYSLGLKLGENRKVFLEDKILSLEEQISTLEGRAQLLTDQKADAASEAQAANDNAAELNDQLLESKKNLAEKIGELASASQQNAAQADSLQQAEQTTLAAEKNLGELRAQYEIAQRQLESTSALLTDIRAKEKMTLDGTAAMAAGDIVAVATDDDGWKKYHQIKEASDITPFGSLNGVTRTLAGSKILVSGYGKKSEINLDTPEIVKNDGRICYQYYRVLSEKFFRLARVCRLAITAPPGSITKP